MAIDYAALAGRYTQAWMGRSAEIAGGEFDPGTGVFGGIPSQQAGAEEPDVAVSMYGAGVGAGAGFKLRDADIAAMQARIAGIEAGQEEVLGAIEGIQWPAPVGPVSTQRALNGGVTAQPMAVPLLALGAIAGFLSLATLKRLLVTLGPKILKGIIGVAAFKEFMDLLGIGAPDDTQIKVRARGAGRRYSIGSNPRVRTLQKVGRHVKRLLVKHEKIIREFIPKKQPRYGVQAGKYLSAVEKKEIRG